MDRAIATSIQTQRKRRRWLAVVGAVGLALGAVLAFRTVLTKPAPG